MERKEGRTDHAIKYTKDAYLSINVRVITELHCVLSSSMIEVRNFLQSECCPLEGEQTTQLLKTLILTVRR